METGIVVVERVGGKSTVSRCFSKYPLKLIVPNKVGSSKTDAVWIYTLSYGGGIVSGDRISLSIGVGDGCTAAVTTQASTKVLLEKGSTCSIAERMQEYHVIAMVVILGPKLKHVQNQVQDEVKKMMSRHFRVPVPTAGRYVRSESQSGPTRPALVASCSAFGPQAIGVVVRIAAVTTESVYMFLRHHLATLEPILGVTPYR